MLRYIVLVIVLSTKKKGPIIKTFKVNMFVFVGTLWFLCTKKTADLKYQKPTKVVCYATFLL